MVARNDVTQILSRLQSGDPAATDELLPLVYEELRLLAAQKLVHEGTRAELKPESRKLGHSAPLRQLSKAFSWTTKLSDRIFLSFAQVRATI